MLFKKQEIPEIILLIKLVKIKINFKKNVKDGDKILNQTLDKMENYFCGIQVKIKANLLDPRKV